MRFARMITAVDAHAAGEPGRVITGAVGGAAGWRWGVATTSVLVAIAVVVFVMMVPADQGAARRPAGRWA